MAQITTGIRAILSSPPVYEAFQNFMGAREGRRRLAEKYIRPFDGMHILDIGCGTAEILNFLPRGIVYHGYDISAAYISHAKKTFGDRATFSDRLLDETEAKKLPGFDLVMGLGVLHHLDDAEAARFMSLAKSALKPGGRLLTRDPCYAEGQNPLARFLISRDRGMHVRSAGEYEALARASFSGVRGDLTHQAWIPYTHWTMEAF